MNIEFPFHSRSDTNMTGAGVFQTEHKREYSTEMFYSWAGLDRAGLAGLSIGHENLI
jgi:hypothetical protein